MDNNISLDTPIENIMWSNREDINIKVLELLKIFNAKTLGDVTKINRFRLQSLAQQTEFNAIKRTLIGLELEFSIPTMSLNVEDTTPIININFSDENSINARIYSVLAKENIKNFKELKLIDFKQLRKLGFGKISFVALLQFLHANGVDVDSSLLPYNASLNKQVPHESNTEEQKKYKYGDFNKNRNKYYYKPHEDEQDI